MSYFKHLIPKIPAPTPQSYPSYLANYYDLKQQSLDSEREKYRKIPVPVTAVGNTSHISNRVKLEMLTDYIATRNIFVSEELRTMLNPANLRGLSSSQQAALLDKVSAQVSNAPEIQKSDAKMKLLKGLAEVGKHLYSEVTDLYGIKQLTSAGAGLFGFHGLREKWEHQEEQALSYLGEEFGGQVLLRVQGLIPDEQTFERNARLRREAANTGKEDLPWWRKQVTWDSSLLVRPVIKEHGWGVPAGVHIPLEIFADPSNYVGFGVFKAGKRGIVALSKIGPLEDAGRVRKMMEEWAPEYQEGADTLRMIKHGAYADLFPTWTKAERKRAEHFLKRRRLSAEEADVLVNKMRSARWEDLFGLQAFKDAPRGQAFKEWIEAGGRLAGASDGPYRAEDIRYLIDKYKAEFPDAVDQDIAGGRKFDDYVDVFHKEERPRVRDNVNHDVLLEISNQRGLNESTRWALLAMYFYGLRSSELVRVKFDALRAQMSKREGFKDVPMEIDGTKANNRRMTEEARRFTRLYLGMELADDVPLAGDPFYAGLKNREGMLADISGAPQRAKAGQAAFWMLNDQGDIILPDAKALNEALESAAVRYAADSNEKGIEAAKILNFYLGGNTSYVYRLSLANRVFAKTIGITGRDIRPTMQSLGHNSPWHTSRYIAWTQLLHGPPDDPVGVRHFFRESGFTDVQIEAAEKELTALAKAEGSNLKNVDGKLFETYPASKGNQRQNDIDAIDTVRAEFLRKALTKRSQTVELVGEGTLPETADAIGFMEELSVFVSMLDDLRFEKGLINARDEVGRGLEKTAIHLEVSEAQKAASVLRAWLRPILDLAAESAAVIRKDPVSSFAAKVLHDPFHRIQIGELERLLADKRKADSFAKRATGKLPSLADLLPELASKLSELTAGQRQRTQLSAKLWDETTLTDAQIRTKNRKNKWGKNHPRRLRTREEQPDILHPFLKDDDGNPLVVGKGVDTSGLMLDTGYIVSNNSAYKGTKWVVKDWIRLNPVEGVEPIEIGGILASPTEGPITYVVLEKLANVWKQKVKVERPGQETLTIDEIEHLVLAKTPDEITVPSSHFHQWRNELEIPISAELFVRAGTGGNRIVQPVEIARDLFDLGSQVPGWARYIEGIYMEDPALTMREILATLKTVNGTEKVTYTAARLRYSGLLVRADPVSGSKEIRYRWTDRVHNELDRLLEEYPNDYAHMAKPADAGAAPPPRGGGRGPGFDPDGVDPNGNPFRDPDDHGPAFARYGHTDSTRHFDVETEDLFRMPLGMEKDQQFSQRGVGTLKNMHRKVANFKLGQHHVPGIYWLVNNPHPSMEKWFRMIVVGHTWAASKYAQAVWRAKSAINEATRFESTAGIMHQPLLDEVGFDPSSALMSKVRARGIIETPTAAQNGYNEGVHMLHPANVEYKKLLEYVQGAAALPELTPAMAKFIEAHPSWVKWTEPQVQATLRNWSYKDNLLDINTFLGTARKDLNTYYEMTPRLHELWDFYHETHMSLYYVLKERGIDPLEVFPDNFLESFRLNWVPHLRTRKFLASSVDNRPDAHASQFGAKPSQMKEQVNEWMITDKVMEAITSGQGIRHDVYENNPVLALARTTREYYRYMAFDEFLDHWATFGIATGESRNPVGVGRALTLPDPQTGKPAILDPEKLRAKRTAEIEAAQRQIDAGVEGVKLPKMPWRLSEEFDALAAKYYGRSWRERLATDEGQEDILKQWGEYEQAANAYRTIPQRMILGSGDSPGYIVAGDPVLTKAYPPNANAELAAFGSDYLNQGGTFGRGVMKVSELANIMRLLATGADLGMFLLHGAVSLSMMVSPIGLIPDPAGTRRANRIVKSVLPEWASDMATRMHLTTKTLPYEARFAWGKGVLKTMHAMGDPLWGKGARHAWYMNTIEERREMQEAGVSFFRSTFLEDIPLPGVVSETYAGPFSQSPLFRKTSKARKALGTVASRPVESFGFFLDVAKTEMWRAYKKMGVLDDTAEYRNVMQGFAASLNSIHGTLDPAIAGLKDKQRVFESAFLLYASLYRRSSLALLKNAMSTNRMRRGPALAGVSGLITAGAALGYLVKGLGLNDDVFDWGSPDFMAIKAGKVRIGLGTPYYTMFRMANDIMQQMMEGDSAGLMELSFTDNTLLKWFRSQTSPTSSLAIDMFNGATFIGDPLRDDEGGWEVNAMGRRVQSTLIPFWIDSLLDSSMPAWSSLGEFFGMRVSPRSPWGRLQAGKQLALETSMHPEIAAWRRSRQAKGLEVDVKFAPVLLTSRLVARSPELTALQKDASDEAQRRGSKGRKEQDTFIRRVKEVRDDTDRKLAGLAGSFERGEITGRQFQDKINILEAEMRGQNKTIGMSFPEVLENFDRKRTERLDNPADRFYYDRAYDHYRVTVTNSSFLHDAFGNFNVDVFVKLQNNFRRQYGENVWNYIKARRSDGRHLPGAVKALDQARELLSDYWNLHKQLWAEGSWQVELMDNWRTLATKQGKDLFALKYPQIDGLLKTLNRHQVSYRQSHPRVDAALVMFYDYVPQVGASEGLLARRHQFAQQAMATL